MISWNCVAVGGRETCSGNDRGRLLLPVLLHRSGWKRLRPSKLEFLQRALFTCQQARAAWECDKQSVEDELALGSLSCLSNTRRVARTTLRDEMVNPRVFHDYAVVGEHVQPLGRVVFELFADVVPRTAEKSV